MARVVFDGNYKVLLVPAGSISDRDAPTVAELTDPYVVDVTTLAPKDFLDYGSTQGRVDASDISTVFGAELMGTWRMQASAQFFLDDDPTANVAYNEMDYGVTKDVVIIGRQTLAARKMATLPTCSLSSLVNTCRTVRQRTNGNGSQSNGHCMKNRLWML